MGIIATNKAIGCDLYKTRMSRVLQCIAYRILRVHLLSGYDKQHYLTYPKFKIHVIGSMSSH